MQILSHHSSSSLSPERLVIITTPRSGSNYLTTAIDSVPGVRIKVEPLAHSRHSHHMKPNAGDKVVPAYLIFNQLKYVLHNLFAVGQLPAVFGLKCKKIARRCAGFKMMAHQIEGLPNERMFWQLLKEYNVKVIRLHRRNILKQLVSDHICSVTRKSVVYDGEPTTVKVRIPLDDLESRLTQIKVYQSYIDQRVSEYGFDNKLYIYEDIDDNVDVINEEVMPWLINKKCNVIIKTKRQNPASLQERVLNYDELVMVLQKLHMTSFLKDT